MNKNKIDLSVFAQINENKPPWAERYELIKSVFPSVESLNWKKIFDDDPHLMGEIVQDIIQTAEASPRRPGKRRAVSAPLTRDHLVRLNGEDYAVEPFAQSLKYLTNGDSIRKIAQKTGMDRNYIHRLTKGKVPDIYDMEIVAKAYNKTPDYFLEYRVSYVLAALSLHLDRIPETTVHFYRKVRKFGRHQ